MNNYSPAQQKFLQGKRKEKQWIHVAQIAVFLIFFIFWEISARKGWMDSFISSSPSLILKTFWEMWKEHSLPVHIGITLTETLISFLLVILLSTCAAVFLWASPYLSRILEPYLVILNSLPKSALAPLFIVWFGANQKTIIIAGISVALFGSIITLYTGFLETDPEIQKLVLTFGGNKYDILTKIILPASVPLFLSIMKVNIGLCLVGVIIGEFIGARKGLGYLIIYGSQTFKLTWVIMSILILCVIAIILYGILNCLEHRYLRK